MRVLALLTLVSLSAQAQGNGRFDRFCDRTSTGRSDRGFDCGSAFFEAFPASGAGTFGVCSTTAPTGAHGEALTFTRASPATCTMGVGGLRSTGISDGDLVSLSNDKPRVEYDANGVLGLLVESAASPINIQTRPICNAAYADVGTPNCAADISAGPWGTTTMGRLTDNDAVAKEGRSQTISTTSATRFTTFCQVKGGTALEATIILAGTGSATGDCTNTITGLSTSTSSIVECTSAVAYGGTLTAVTMSILVGDAVADQGTLFVEGCQTVPNALYRTSITDAAGVAVARATDAAQFNSVSWPSSNVISMAATLSPEWPTASAPIGGVLTMNGGNASSLFTNAGLRFFTGGTSTSIAAMDSTYPARVYGFDDGVTAGAAWNSLTGAAATGTVANRFGTQLGVCDGTPAGLGKCDGIITRICADPNPTRCR